MNKPNLELDLIDCQPIKDKVRKDDGYATRLYDALCNVKWYHGSDLHSSGTKNDYWSCSWRYAGDLVAKLRVSNEDYLDYYCSGNEGFIAPDVAEDLKQIGWRGKNYGP
tara:strand:- start:2298 stop:2624 length:327 start_codon:yes stop_codon:yes gene_type:complete